MNHYSSFFFAVIALFRQQRAEETVGRSNTALMLLKHTKTYLKWKRVHVSAH